MVEVNFIVGIVIIIVSIAIFLAWLLPNYTNITNTFFNYLSNKLPYIFSQKP